MKIFRWQKKLRYVATLDDLCSFTSISGTPAEKTINFVEISLRDTSNSEACGLGVGSMTVSVSVTSEPSILKMSVNTWFPHGLAGASGDEVDFFSREKNGNAM